MLDVTGISQDGREMPFYGALWVKMAMSSLPENSSISPI
jgi:hypothetical protein